MSVTFGCPGAPHRHVRRPCSSPDMGLTCTDGDRCGYCDDGFEDVVETDAPSANLSNANAAALFEAVGFGVYGDWSYGTIPHAAVPDALRRILRAVNTDGVAEAYARPPGVDVGAMGARCIDPGEDAEAFIERIYRVRAVLVYAADHGYDVSWD